MYDILIRFGEVRMTGNEFIKRLRKVGRKRGIDVRHETRRGKGSHGRLYFGRRFTTIKDPRAEIGKGLFRAMLRQLDLSMNDLTDD